MNLLTKIRAFFNFKGEKVEMELSKAEIKQGRVYLHPADKPSETFVVKTKSVDLIINPEEETSDENILIINSDKEKKPQKSTIKISEQEIPENSPPENSHHQIQTIFPKKRKFVVSLYPDKYEVLIENINSNGYKRAEYLLACVNSAKKASFDAMYKKYTVEHKERCRLEKSANNN